MLRLGGAAIRMQSNSDICTKLTFLVGAESEILGLSKVRPLKPFDEKVMDFLNEVSKELMGSREAKAYSDVITFAFWARRASLKRLMEQFEDRKRIRLGKGVVFHIAPSNVPVNFAYSLVAGLITGNANVVRVPSKDYAQVKIITNAFNKVIEHYEELRPYIICVRFERDKEINDFFSLLADMRIIWGGDETIRELRKSPLSPRAGEITFADRYSLAFIDSDAYMSIEDKGHVAADFYNDTFLTDQNACTSPSLIVWYGNRIEEAKELFWAEERRLAAEKYSIQPVQAVNKLTWALEIASITENAKIERHADNLIVRVKVSQITSKIMEMRGNCGHFYEYDCKDIQELRPIFDSKKCQTIGYIGDADVLTPLVEEGAKGVDRIVPVGRTMDFDLIWDGYNIPTMLTRTVSVI